ncbi:MAG: transcription factor jumonji JmjC domain protein [Rhodospirillales bacterium]|nr:transcription factor jumonji JmjC domain protein [Rhodospirillales bacterium]
MDASTQKQDAARDGRIDRPLPTDADRQFARCYNKSSFMFEHGFAGHPVFDLPELVALSRRLPEHPYFAYWSNGPVRVEDRWETGQRVRESLQETIAEIEHNNSLVILKHVEQDPVYAPYFQEFLARIVDCCGPEMRDDVHVGEVLILISSPNRVTSYHIDAEANFLVQVTGDKIAHVFPHDHPAVMSDAELERFHAGDFNGAVYKETSQATARSFDLKAGYGIHIPTHAPHWVQNGNNVSVALSVNFELKSVADLAMIYRFNRWARKLGARPSSPGVHPRRDGAKRAIAKTALSIKQLIRPTDTGPSYATWSPNREAR